MEQDTKQKHWKNKSRGLLFSIVKKKIIPMQDLDITPYGKKHVSIWLVCLSENSTSTAGVSCVINSITKEEENPWNQTKNVKKKENFIRNSRRITIK